MPIIPRRKRRVEFRQQSIRQMEFICPYYKALQHFPLFSHFSSILYQVSYPMSFFSPIHGHQVFINYRGEQLRHSFVSHLVDAFERHGMNFFVDKYELRGKDLKNLFGRIQESRIALAIFSTRYAESSWCMDELVKMKKLADKEKLEVIPIFYKVRARDVRNQTAEFGDNFWTLARVSSGGQIKKWKEALECISDKTGLSLKDDSSEADFVKKIVMEVQRVVAAIGLEEEENHFGKKRRKDCNCPCELPELKKSKTNKVATLT